MEITETIADTKQQEVKAKWNRTWLIANSMTGAYESFDEFWNEMQDNNKTEQKSVTREEAEQEAMRIEEKFKNGAKKVNPYEAKA